MRISLSPSWLPFAGVVALWVPAMIAASYVWGHGEYYDYGWFVPPAALLLGVRRWRDDRSAVVLPGMRMVLAMAALWLPWTLVLRVLGNADPSWRMPMSLLGITAALGGHWLIGVSRGWKVSAAWIWLTLLCLSALPWPSVVESGIVRHLTQWVVMAVSEVFQLVGKPVVVLGDRLQLGELTVEVTDGCSGVRSFQSFVMATWFFAELQRLRAVRVLVLLACACGVAFLVNMGRTYALAEIRFTRGEEAFHHAHDSLGLVAFLVSALAFYFISGWLAEKTKRQVLRRAAGKQGDASQER